MDFERRYNTAFGQGAPLGASTSKKPCLLQNEARGRTLLLFKPRPIRSGWTTADHQRRPTVPVTTDWCDFVEFQAAFSFTIRV